MHSLSMSAMDASTVRPNRSLLLFLLLAALLFLGNAIDRLQIGQCMRVMRGKAE
ncbi:hypothetical protein [Pseudomonas sp. TMP9]|uniref:hypothetical protein n=1 Tax=unclassified Pseudomonas TaxID=196821 RepID=UPI0030CFF8E3